MSQRPRVWLIKDPARERRQFLWRSWFIFGTVWLALSLLAVRAYQLQIVRHEHYTTLSTNNRVMVQPIAPTRGLIYDAKGVLLAENIPSFSLELVSEQVEDLDQTLRDLQQMVTISEEDLQRFHRERKRKRRFESVPLRLRLTEEEVARIAVNRYRLPGVEINSRLTRYYPFKDLTAHVLGYVARINEQELTVIDNSNYAATTHIGKGGVEGSQERYLHGKVGYRQVEVNARGRTLRVLEETPPEPGNHLNLYLDVELQQLATRAFGAERGALVAINPKNGAVLALVSVPSFDSNLFVNGISSEDYKMLTQSASRPLFNRALRGQYPPGSTVKPFVGLAGLEYRVISAEEPIYCPGYYQIGDNEHKYRDWKRWGHGRVALTDAIRESCDVYFYELGLQLGIDRLASFMNRFGFGQPTGIDIGGELPGLMPNRAWKRARHNDGWYSGETLITSIGQGFFLATPVQLARATAALANQGLLYNPRVVKSMTDLTTQAIHLTQAVVERRLDDIHQENWRTSHRAMMAVVHDPKGTANGIGKGILYHIAGKTGTAQVFGIKQDERYVASEVSKNLHDHALFVAFAPVEDPQMAVGLIVENGGSGSKVAAPIARQLFDYLLGAPPLMAAPATPAVPTPTDEITHEE